jgi:hypothetical protein
MDKGGSWMVNVGCFLDLRPIAEARPLKEIPFDCLDSLNSLDDEVLSPHQPRELSVLADTADIGKELGIPRLMVRNRVGKKEIPWRPAGRSTCTNSAFLPLFVPYVQNFYVFHNSSYQVSDSQPGA